MAEEVMVSIPQPIYERAERLARSRRQAVADVLAQAIALVEEQTNQMEIDEDKMAQEEAAYEAILDELLVKHKGEYVAIHQGRMIDHDWDEVALLRRLDARYPHEAVLMKQVRPGPEPELRFRSPRFV